MGIKFVSFAFISNGAMNYLEKCIMSHVYNIVCERNSQNSSGTFNFSKYCQHLSVQVVPIDALSTTISICSSCHLFKAELTCISLITSRLSTVLYG